MASAWSCFTPQLPMENYSHHKGTGGITMLRVSAYSWNCCSLALLPAPLWYSGWGSMPKAQAAPVSTEALLPEQ